VVWPKGGSGLLGVTEGHTAILWPGRRIIEGEGSTLGAQPYAGAWGSFGKEAIR